MIRKRTVTAVVGAVGAVALAVAVAPPASAEPTLSVSCSGFGSGDVEIEPFGTGGEFAVSTTVPAPQPIPAGIPVELQTSAGSFTSVTLASSTNVLFDDFSGPAVTTATVTTSHKFIIHAPDIGDITCDVTTGGTINW
ncbi:hypothetical protein LO772_10930 [Yinghuangia sp. ASG 101]|uniref:hypothetical protein n=1 Tax=Yinghuangia sp. ASG 101 TaxID=2896848 RepID=UPI001E41D96F|nr:hypothetical protein [Yinghuangia sp. ASG 101]UGQ14065.1 hypothetical protein LO772_10930 [Yinghuangia sp. ASG 101]